MKFELDNDCLLQANAIGIGALSAGHLIPKSPLSDKFFTTRLGEGPSRHLGVQGATLAGTLAIASKSADTKTKKDILKLCGVGWLACAGIHALNLQQKHEKKDPAIGMAAGKIALAGLNLYAGFRN